MKRDIWLSVHPRWATAILDGSKTVELRRRGPTLGAGSRAVIYATAPVSSALGTAVVSHVEEMTVGELWKVFGKNAHIAEAEFFDYFKGCDRGYAIVLEAIILWRASVDLGCLRDQFGLEPAQGWRYLEPGMTDELARSTA